MEKTKTLSSVEKNLERQNRSIVQPQFPTRILKYATAMGSIGFKIFAAKFGLFREKCEPIPAKTGSLIYLFGYFKF
jgi:hypothetical protein